MRTPLTIIVPAKHEQHTIISTMESLRHTVRTPHTILVVNVSDANDTTASLVASYIKTHPHIRLIHKIHAHGTFGMALTLGFQTVKAGAVVPFMADICDDPEDIDRMYTIMEKGWDIVAASRYMQGGKKNGGPKAQSFFSFVVCRTLQAITGVPTHDVSNAYKMYRVSVLNNLRISPASGVEASMEMTLQAYFNGAKITEIPTVWKGRTAGSSKFHVFERTPKYFRIYVWAVRKALRARQIPTAKMV